MPVLGIALALLASVSWGLSDFLGGIKSRSLPLLTVMVVSQAVGALTVVLVVLLRGQGPPAAEFIPFAIVGGFAVALGLAAFYRGLAVGTMSVVAPISAVGSVLPVVAGILQGERPSIGQIAGIIIAVIGVLLAAREPPRPDEPTQPVAAGALLAVLAACCFGIYLIAMRQASGQDAFWATLVQRFAAIGLLAAVMLVVRRPLGNVRPHLMGLGVIGLCDMLAALLYSVASTMGMISLIAVIASLYPVVTVILAHVVLGERLALTQRIGAIAAFAGVGMISLT